ncbi:uncharacterized protein SETTUDRAFT_162285 [Exserohilum turcica Et28A]|uniref:Uncharacterized protein n=1 Tax=Exserohilum turcicum (strain 28A) TaxID=671987 RepID=R0KFP2_EXST2|nr:uncharacterized protein SETTUDRAFT_162285 [Exserohilum turcica Et28A]EOA91623.1 hypothetical protein SETTUDRAFT_162285 [Exserohilum turcica Et28A]
MNADLQPYGTHQEAFPPPLPNHLSAEYSPALSMMQQFHADLLRMDEEHLQHRTQAAVEIASPCPCPFPDDDDQPPSDTLLGRMRTWYRRLSSRRSRTSNMSSP